jgi:uncharacterized protein DUF3574
VRSAEAISSRSEAYSSLAAALLFVFLSGCAVSPTQPAPPSSEAAAYSCLLPTEQRMLVAELFFARGIRGREPLTDAEWAEFAALTITPNFPDGFTVFDGDGQWRNPQTGRIAGNRTKILLVAAPRTPDLARRVSAVIEAYKARFHHQSVGIITRDSCAAF